MTAQLTLYEWQERERAARVAEQILRGECCGNCQHAGHLRLGIDGPPSTTVSCERPRSAWSGDDPSYWHDRSHTCAHWTPLRAPP